MNLTAETPIYLPLVFPESLLAACHRLARDLEQLFGARPPLRHQPAPFGQPAILVAPDPAYTAAVAPAAPQTFVVKTWRDELTITGADPFGTVLGLAWLATEVLGIPVGEEPPSRPVATWELSLDYQQRPWPQAARAWAVGAEVAAWSDEELWLLGEGVIRAGGNRLEVVGPSGEPVREVARCLGLSCGPATMASVTRERLRRGEVPRWW